MKKMIRRIMVGLLVLLVLLQFYRPARNLSDEQTYHVSKQYPVSAEVGNILQGACYDCHSNRTEYPWYANVQPVAWWLANHVKEGKGELNFSAFTNRRIAVQNHKFEEIIETVQKKEMPLNSYTWTHGEARLTEQQRQTLMDWAQMNMDSLRAKYPADSLIMRRK